MLLAYIHTLHFAENLALFKPPLPSGLLGKIPSFSAKHLTLSNTIILSGVTVVSISPGDHRSLANDEEGPDTVHAVHIWYVEIASEMLNNSAPNLTFIAT